jgi:hypothetical protein
VDVCFIAPVHKNLKLKKLHYNVVQMTDITFTRLTTQNIQDQTTQVSQIIYDDLPVAWIEYDALKRVIVYSNNEWYYIDGENLTVQKVVEALGYKRFVVSWAERGERYEVRDELVINAPQHTIRVFSNINKYVEYSEYDDLELETF